VVSNTLSSQRIETPDDACLPGRSVEGPFTAYCQDKVIDVLIGLGIRDVIAKVGPSRT
jgi:hypothetical protein